MNIPVSLIETPWVPSPRSSSLAQKLDAAALRRHILSKLTYEVGKSPQAATTRDWFAATALAVRDFAVSSWLASMQRSTERSSKRVYYLSLEFLVGRLLLDTIGNLGLTEVLRDALAMTGLDMDQLREQEADAALGNGGLGRLAACFMESMATLGIPAYGYGIRYEHGLFEQRFVDGRQQELPEEWLRLGNPWEFERPEVAHPIGFGGSVAIEHDAEGRASYAWHPGEMLSAVAYDMPITGAGGHHTNTLRLWAARATSPLNLENFNHGDHVGAMGERVRAEAISRVLYPGDESEAGQQLRLKQEFFFVSASLQDLLLRHLHEFGDLHSLPDKMAIQFNDTHPAIGIAELMRLLVDVHGVGWTDAWRITTACVSYTNHTLLPEALETWPVSLLERLLPRHMQIIYLLNSQHLEHVRACGHTSDAQLAAASLIDEQHGRRVRMGHLAFLGSHAVNGVSALHTDLLQRTVFRDLDAVYGGRISNKTNGITFRRWLHRVNPGLTHLLLDALGERILHDAEKLADLAGYAEDSAFRAAFAAQRRRNKEALAHLIFGRTGTRVDPQALFDVQVKRIHEYKRQLLNILQIIALYDAIRSQPARDWVPRVKILAGKAAPSYRVAKQIIRLAHGVAKVVNSDPFVADRLKVVFLPNYNVSLAELIIPAADLSEQISTAGMEASGTGNMKLALNGALTIGTLDGANIEIRDHVGADTMFIFGLTTDQVEARRRDSLAAHHLVAANPVLERALQLVASGAFSPNEPDRYQSLITGLVARDTYMVMADFESYCETQASVDALWKDPAWWWRASVFNTAGLNWFSSDRTIAEYAEEIWGVPLLPADAGSPARQYRKAG